MAATRGLEPHGRHMGLAAEPEDPAARGQHTIVGSAAASIGLLL